MTGSFEFLKDYDGEITINGQKVHPKDASAMEILNQGELDIVLTPRALCEKVKYRVLVRPWMASNSGNLDFHARWNKGIPMPNREMLGTIEAETPGMYLMELTDYSGNHWRGYVSKAGIVSMEEIN